MMRAVGDLLEHPIEIANDPDFERLRQQEEPTGSRRYFINKLASGLNRLGLPGTDLERQAKEEELV